MRVHRVTLPEIALIAGTRGLIGLGAGLLISGRMKAHQRKVVGVTLLVAGALSTIPIALRLFRGQRAHDGRVDEPMARTSAETARMRAY